MKLNRPLVEFTLKNDELDDPILSEEHIDILGYASNKEINDVKNQGLIINALLSDLFASINIKLVDFKIEFGRINENKITKIILADEISPDSCRLWDKSSSEKLDKDRFRKNLGGLIDAYKEVATRLGIDFQKQI